MATKTYAVTYVCDGCGAEAPATMIPEGGAVSTPPEGWHNCYQSGVEMRVAGWYISDICPECQAVPFPELVARLVAQHAARFGPPAGPLFPAVTVPPPLGEADHGSV